MLYETVHEYMGVSIVVLDVKGLSESQVPKFHVQFNLNPGCVVLAWLDWGFDHAKNEQPWIELDPTRSSPQSLLDFAAWIATRGGWLKSVLYGWWESPLRRLSNIELWKES